MPILPTGEDAKNVDQQFTRGLIDLVRDERSLLERRRSHAWAHIITGLTSEGKLEDSVDVVKERHDHLPSDLSARTFGKPSIQVVELSFGFRREVDPARHERAAHLASRRALTSLAGIARSGSTFSAS